MPPITVPVRGERDLMRAASEYELAHGRHADV
jgi:hypothetical protein